MLSANLTLRPGFLRPRSIHAQCAEELNMVLTRLEAEAATARNSARTVAQQAAAEAAASRAKDLKAAQELETRAMERCEPNFPGSWLVGGVGGARETGVVLIYLT